MRWPRLTQHCTVCHCKLWPWQGFRSPSKYLVGGLIIRAKPRIVCSERCASVLYDWSRAGIASIDMKMPAYFKESKEDEEGHARYGYY